MIVTTFFIGCAGVAYPQRTFEEAELCNTDDFVCNKRGKDFVKFEKESRPNGLAVYAYDNSTVTYIYEFNEL